MEDLRELVEDLLERVKDLEEQYTTIKSSSYLKVS